MISMGRAKQRKKKTREFKLIPQTQIQWLYTKLHKAHQQSGKKEKSIEHT